MTILKGLQKKQEREEEKCEENKTNLTVHISWQIQLQSGDVGALSLFSLFCSGLQMCKNGIFLFL